jgi:hypothetical protein
MTMTTNSSTYWCSPRLLKVLYTSMILLLWVCGMYLCCSVDQKDSSIKILTMSINSSPSPSSSPWVYVSSFFLMLIIQEIPRLKLRWSTLVMMFCVDFFFLTDLIF